MKKRLLCLVLALTLCAGSAFAAGEELFPAVNSYPGYADVKESDWFYENARLCNEVGLMNGTDKGFEPEKTLTVAECAAVATRIRVALTGEAMASGTPLVGQTRPWYQDYLDYMGNVDATLASILANPEENCSRLQYILLLNAALPSEQGLLGLLNSITSLPDTNNRTVLAFYNAGILTGVDEYGTFAGGRSLTRAECAAMVSRLVRPELRKTFTPTALVQQKFDEDVTAITVNGRDIPRFEILGRALDLAYEQDMVFYQDGGRLDWDYDYGVGDLGEYFLQRSMGNAIRSALLDERAEALGCTKDELPAKLAPDPGHDVLSAYAQEQGYLCAKHILVDDIETANAVLDGLKAVPTLEQFNALLAVFGTDPGMSSYPDGYLFSSGEMVPEFENGTRALSIGSYSTQPVQSGYGYHIIWRLDPATHPDMLTQYQENVAVSLLEEWVKTASITVNQDVLDSINVRMEYANYLTPLSTQSQQ